MGMSTHIVGFKPADAKWKKMKAVFDACEAAGTKLPREVEDFFGGENPDESGVEVDIEKTPCVREWGDDGREGFEVDVTNLPKDVTVIRFYNSW